MVQWGFYFNQDRCVGCKTCIMACKNWNESRRGDALVNVICEKNDQTAVGSLERVDNFTDPATGMTHYEKFRKFHMKEDWRCVDTYEKGEVIQKPDNTFESTFDRRYLSISCNHCNQPVCVEVCPEGIIYKEDKFGAVLVDNEKCISCGECQAACPWDTPQFYDPEFDRFDMDDPKRPRMTKCTLCVDRIAEGLKPACVASCFNRALDAGPMDELKKKYANQYVSAVPEFNSDYAPNEGIHTKPNIIFKKKGRV